MGYTWARVRRRSEITSLGAFNFDRFRAVVFDLDMTLTDSHMYPVLGCEWFLKEAGVYTDERLEEYLGHVVARYRNAIKDIVSGGPYHSPYEIIRKAMSESFRDIGFEPDEEMVEAAAKHFRSLHLKLSTVFPGAHSLLETLQGSGKKLGIITNSFEGHADKILEKLHLKHFFSAVVDSGTVRAYKPASEIFTAVTDALGVSSKDTVFVGDEYYADMVGAKSAGMTAVWINIRHRSIEEARAKYGIEFTPDLVVHSIEELSKY